MDKEWKPKVGDLVWVRGAVTEVDDDDLPYMVSFDGDELWLRRAGIRPDAPEPAEIDDVVVLRSAANILIREGYPLHGEFVSTIYDVSGRIEAARRVLTPLDALKALVAIIPPAAHASSDAKKEAMDNARRAIAAAEKGEG